MRTFDAVIYMQSELPYLPRVPQSDRVEAGSADEALELLFELWNVGDRALERGTRSLSVGDIISLAGHGVWECLPSGWRRLDKPAPEVLEALREITQAAGELNAKQHAGLTDLDTEYSWLYRAEQKARAAIAKAEAQIDQRERGDSHAACAV